MQLCQAMEAGGSLEEAERLYPELLADLYAIRFHMQKLAAQGGAFQAEQQLYAEKQAQLQASIQQVRGRRNAAPGQMPAPERAGWLVPRCSRTLQHRPRPLPTLPLLPPAPLPSVPQAEQDIEDRKRELVEARVELAHKQEYEVLRKQIMQARREGSREQRTHTAHREQEEAAGSRLRFAAARMLAFVAPLRAPSQPVTLSRPRAPRRHPRRSPPGPPPWRSRRPPSGRLPTCSSRARRWTACCSSASSSLRGCWPRWRRCSAASSARSPRRAWWR